MPDDASDPHTHAAMAEATAAIVAAEPLPAVLERAAWRALGGGLAGGVAMLAQVALLMPARTLMTVQMRRGGGAWDAARALLKEGGVRRFYAGVGPALVQAPLSRFGDTASIAGALALLGSLEATRTLPIALQTLAASLTAAAFRVLLTPLDVLKVVQQSDGAAGWAALRANVRAAGPRALFVGGGAMAANTLAAHFSFFGVFNTLQANLPHPEPLAERVLRNAFIGFSAGVVSDITANSIRVVKTVRMSTNESYGKCLRGIIKADGVYGLLFRGLKTRLAANAVQGFIYSFTWRSLDDLWVRRNGDGLHEPPHHA